MKKSTPFVLLTVIALPIFALLLIGALLGPEHWFMVSRYWGKSKPIQFYGQVVNQRLQPIEGATVTITVGGFKASSIIEPHAQSYMSITELRLMTDADGRFKVENTNGMYLRITSIEKSGYATFPDSRWDRYELLGYGYEQERGVPYYVSGSEEARCLPAAKGRRTENLLAN